MELCIKKYTYIHAGTAKRRQQYSKYQRSVLETSFRLNVFPNKTTLRELALQTELNESVSNNGLQKKDTD